MASKKCDEVVDFQMAKTAKRAHMLARGEKYREIIKSWNDCTGKSDKTGP